MKRPEVVGTGHVSSKNADVAPLKLIIASNPITTPVDFFSTQNTYIASNPSTTPVDFLVHRTHRSILSKTFGAVVFLIHLGYLRSKLRPIRTSTEEI